jgi:hypothetical protein
MKEKEEEEEKDDEEEEKEKALFKANARMRVYRQATNEYRLVGTTRCRVALPLGAGTPICPVCTLQIASPNYGPRAGIPYQCLSIYAGIP